MSTTVSDVLHLVMVYGYLGLFAAAFVAALGIGVPIPLTALLLTLGAYSAAPHGPSFAAVAVAGLAGVKGGHLVVYGVGRLGGRHLAGRLARVERQSRMRRVVQASSRLRGGRPLLVFLSRFLLTSIASPLSLFAGVTRMPFAAYLALEVAGESLYVLGNLGIGRAFGPQLTARGGGLLLVWVAVAVATLLPLVLLRLVAWAIGRRAGAGVDITHTVHTASEVASQAQTPASSAEDRDASAAEPVV
jgi:membrane protein DedA with SNARE-associated domain